MHAEPGVRISQALGPGKLSQEPLAADRLAQQVTQHTPGVAGTAMDEYRLQRDIKRKHWVNHRDKQTCLAIATPDVRGQRILREKALPNLCAGGTTEQVAIVCNKWRCN